MMSSRSKLPPFLTNPSQLYSNESDLPADWHQVVADIAEYMTEQTNIWKVDSYISGMLNLQDGAKALQLAANMLRESVLPKLERGRRGAATVINASPGTKERMTEITERMLAENKPAGAIRQKLGSLRVDKQYIPHYVSFSQGIATITRNLAVLDKKLQAFNYNAERAAAEAEKDSVTQPAGMFAVKHATEEAKPEPRSPVALVI